MLSLLTGLGGSVLLPGCGGGGASSASASTMASSSSSTTCSSSSSGSCVADPTETAGPYPADGTNTANGSVVNTLVASGVVRSDIRSSFGSSTTTAPGIPLVLTINLVNVNASCSALSGYAIYLWHCSAAGKYSLYDVPAENYLRGVQVTDSNGQLTFTTIFPGCYSGRYPHMHFEVYRSVSTATQGSNSLLTSQMCMPRDAASAVYSANSTVYAGSTANLAQVTIASDNVFGDNTTAQIAAQTPSLTGSASAGYTGSITIGMRI